MLRVASDHCMTFGLFMATGEDLLLRGVPNVAIGKVGLDDFGGSRSANGSC